MRIILKYRYWGHREWAFLRTVIEIESLKIAGNVDFLLDTGAGQSILSERDARRLGLAYHNFSEGKPAAGIGGTAKTYRIDEKVTFHFETVEGTIYSPFRRGIEVLEEPGKEKHLPSLLGLEFLEELHFKLTYDMPTRAIFLEI